MRRINPMDPFGFSPAQYTAAATWMSAFVLLISLLFAWRQVGEARRLREEQARPWVVVKFDPGFVFAIVVENIGRTVAKDIRIEFEPTLESTWNRPWDWEESTLLTDGIPMLPPGDTLRFDFDTYENRIKAELPMQYAVTVSYADARGRTLPKDEYLLDLRLYMGMARPLKGLPDLVRAVEGIRQKLSK